MHLNGTAAVVRHQAGPVSQVITREDGALLTLSPAERAAVGAELARLTVKMAHLAARLDRLHTRPCRARSPIQSARQHPAWEPGCAEPGNRFGGGAMAVSREQLIADPKSGTSPMSRDEKADRAHTAGLAAQWLLATSPFGHRCEVQVSEPAVLDDMHRTGWRIDQPKYQTASEPETV